MAGQAYRFLPAQETPHDREGGVQFRNLCSDPLLGHHFLFVHMSKAWRAIHELPADNFWSISYDFFNFLGRGRQVYMGKKMLKMSVAGHFWPAAPRSRGPFTKAPRAIFDPRARG